jgi:hypothetical protein
MKNIFRTTTLAVITVLLSSQSLQNQLLAQSADGSYEVHISATTEPLKMQSSEKVKVYNPSKSSKITTVKMFNAFVSRDSYYWEFHLPSNFGKGKYKVGKKITVCSADKKLEFSVLKDNNLISQKCHDLTIRQISKKTIFAGYVNPTFRPAQFP